MYSTGIWERVFRLQKERKYILGQGYGFLRKYIDTTVYRKCTTDHEV